MAVKAGKDLRRSTSVMAALRNAREAKGWTWTDVGRATNFDAYTIYRWETLVTSPRLEDLLRWARALDLNVMMMQTGDKE